MPELQLIGLVAIFAGVTAIFSIGIRLWLIWRLGRRARAVGVVAGHVVGGRPPDVVVGFADQFGNRHRFTLDHLSCWQARYGPLVVGDRVDVSYLPAEPQRARLLVDTVELGLGASRVSHLAFLCYRYVVSPEPWVKISVMFEEELIRRQIRDYGISVLGTVLQSEPSKDTSKSQYGCVKTRYETESGETVEFIESISSIGINGRTLGMPKVGNRVRIVYLPESPRVAMIRDYRMVIGDSLARIIGGLLVIALGFLLFKL